MFVQWITLEDRGSNSLRIKEYICLLSDTIVSPSRAKSMLLPIIKDFSTLSSELLSFNKTHCMYSYFFWPIYLASMALEEKRININMLMLLSTSSAIKSFISNSKVTGHLACIHEIEADSLVSMPIEKISGLSQFLTCKYIFNKIPKHKIIFLVITKTGRKYTKMLIIITSWWQKWQASVSFLLLPFCIIPSYKV